jgi:hypothetical protein
VSTRLAARSTWSLAALALILLAVGVVLSGVSSGTEVSPSHLFALAIPIVFALVGPLIASRQPRNPLGWLFCWIAIAAALAVFSRGYVEYWLDGNGGSRSLAETAAWYHDISWIPFVLPAATFLILLFPDGRLLTPRWRPVAWCAGVGTAAVFMGEGLAPGPLEDFPEIANPYGVDGVAVDLLLLIAALLLVVALVGSPLSLVLRYRRAGHEQQQQIKWLALAGAVATATFVISLASYDAVGASVADAAIMLSVLGLPLATGVAILRHRLYDIDVVINRTLVYGALTATLAGAYLASVLLLQLALSGVTSDNGLAVAGSTLAVAALFRPARARIQAGVDRRFFRRRYDARLTLESFSARLRDQIELDALSAELGTVVRNTLEPAHVSLWLRRPR